MSANRPQSHRPPTLLVGRFFGVPIYFHASWLIIAAVLTIYYAPIIGDALPQASTRSTYLAGALFAVIFAVCVLAHELGHTAVSLAFGHPVRRVVIFLLGGVSEMDSEPPRPREEFLIAAAGPFVSLLLGGAGWLGWSLLGHDSMPGVLALLLLWSNLVVGVFNLLPGLPLDGGRLVRALVWAGTHNRLVGTRVGAWCGRGVAVLVAISGLVVDRTGWGLAAFAITLLLAVYLWFGAGQSLKVGQLMARTPQLNLIALLRRGVLVPAGVSVADALRRAWDGNARGLVVVDSYDRPRAIVDEARVGAIPMDRRAWTALDTVARPLEPGLVLNLRLHGKALLDAVRSTPANEYLVVDDDGAPAGILATADLAAALQGPA